MPPHVIYLIAMLSSLSARIAPARPIWPASQSDQPALAKPLSRGALTAGMVAFTHVNVVTMTDDSVTRDVSVLVRDGRIVAMGRSIAIPSTAQRIDGRGRYLMPGLSDMHTHLFSDESLPASAGPAELGVMLANGITTARLMIGTPAHLTLRDRVARGDVLGPKLWVASAQFAGRQFPNTHLITRPDQAPVLVRAVADSGFDFIKLTIGLTSDVFEAITAGSRWKCSSIWPRRFLASVAVTSMAGLLQRASQATRPF